MAKKINPKAVAKKSISAVIYDALVNQGYTVSDDSDAYGFTGGTLIVADEVTDVQVKLITPKAGVDRYVVQEDEVEEVEVVAEA